VTYEVPDHEEVSGEAHVVDDGELVANSLGDRLAKGGTVTLLGTRPDELRKVGAGTLVVGLALDAGGDVDLG
jgi:hypothetical protein